MSSLIGSWTIVFSLLALLGGILAARKIYRSPHNVGLRELGVFSFCYLISLVGGPFALGWRYPTITIWFLADASCLYVPVLIALAFRCLGWKTR